jgi:hypothetical protein
MNYIGDFTPGKSVGFKFPTHKSDGTPITLSGTPVMSVYKKGSPTESTAGVTLTVDYDSRTGCNDVVIDTSADGTFYAAGNDFEVEITTGTVDSISVAGTPVGSFSLANRSALRPTTADRTLVVDPAGLADANTVKLGPTGSGSTQTARDLGASVLLSPGTGTGQISLSSGQVTVGTLASAAIASIWNALTSGMTTAGSIGKKLADWVLGADSKAVLSSDETGSGLTTLAPAATALSNVQWTNARAALLDHLDADVSSRMATFVYTAPDNTGISQIVAKLPTNAMADEVLLEAAIALTQQAGSAVTLPSIPAGWIDAAGIAAGALTGKGDWTVIGDSVVLAADGLDAVIIETGLNARQSLAINSAAAAGVLAGAATTTVTIAAAGVPATNRITATVDASGNRSAVTLSPPA